MAHRRQHSGSHVAPSSPRRASAELPLPRPFFLDTSSLDNSSLDSTPTSATALLYRMPKSPPPSSFTFPFQAYPGNPDPGLGIPGVSRRRSSLDSDDALYHSLSHSPSSADLPRPVAPFMTGAAGESTGSLPRTSSSSSNSIYRQSAAANLTHSPAVEAHTLPRNASVHSFRAPFLSPSSRPSSSFWAPPSYPSAYPVTTSPSASFTALPLAFLQKSKPPLPSTRLTAPLTKSEKPWLAKPEPGTRLSYCITFLMIVLGIAGAAALCFFGITSVNTLDDAQLCIVLNEEFSSSSLDTTTWNREVELGGFGNGEFQMTTNTDDNLFLRNGQLYIMPTLTSDKVNNVLDGGKFTLDGCTTNNKSACTATSNAAQGTVINPVQSARINTQGKKSIRFGKVEFSAKLPTGDWLWPAVWMLPEDNTYGAWPISGEIDILEARGNAPSYPAQGNNFVRSSLNYGPFPTLTNQIFGWFSSKRSSFADGFHTYTLEWTEEFMRFSVDSKLHAMLQTETKGKNNYWDKAGFPQTARNGSAELVVVQNPYEGVEGATKAAPFDRPFHLVIDLAAGGTSGWFPDNKGGKPWFDGSLTAMRDFAKEQDTWSKTWPQNQDERAFRIDYIKMWEKCR